MGEPSRFAWMDRLNPLLVRLLRSPLHWLASPGLAVLTIEGRRSGREYSIPVGYHDVGDAIVVMVSDAPARQWWRNFEQPRDIGIHLRGRALRGVAEVLAPGSDEYRERAEQAFRRARFIGRIFDVDFDPALGLRDDQLRALSERAAIVRIEVPGRTSPKEA